MDKTSAYLRDLFPFSERVIEQAFLALSDDIGKGDITTLALSLDGERVEEATIVAREQGILCGTFEAKTILEAGGLETQWHKDEGDAFEAGETLATVRGKIADLLGRERTVLNYLQILSGIATLCGFFSKRFPGKVASLRKTHPGIAFSEKRAIAVGGVFTHRLCLDDGFLIKDNHLALVARELFGESKISENQKLRAVEESLRRARKYRTEHHLERAFIEVEVESMAQALIAANMFLVEKVPDMVLLDNMEPNIVRKCVQAIRKVAGPKLLIDSSGGITSDNLKLYLDTGVDVASMSFLTLGARPLDIGMKIVGYK